MGNTPSCRVGTISSRVTKDNLDGSGRSSPEPLWHPRPPFSSHSVHSDLAFALWIPHPGCLRRPLAWPRTASPTTFSPLPTPHSRLPPNRGAALRTAAALAPRPPAASPAPRGLAPRSSVPPPGSPQPPPPAPVAGAVKPTAAEPAPELPRLLSFLCVRASGVGAEGEGGGRSVCLAPAAFARAARSAAGEAGAQGRVQELAGRLRAARARWSQPRAGELGPQLGLDWRHD